MDILGGLKLPFYNTVFQVLNALGFFYIASQVESYEVGLVSYLIAISGLASLLGRFGLNERLIENESLEKNQRSHVIKSLRAQLNTNIVFVGVMFVILLFVTDIDYQLDDIVVIALLVYLQPIANFSEQLAVLDQDFESLIRGYVGKIIAVSLIISLLFLGVVSYKYLLILALINAVTFLIVNPKYWTPLGFNKIGIGFYKRNGFFFLSTLIYLLPLTIDKIYAKEALGLSALGNYELHWKIGFLIELGLVYPAMQLLTKRFFLGINTNQFYVFVGLLILVGVFTIGVADTVIKLVLPLIDTEFDYFPLLFSLIAVYFFLNMILAVIRMNCFYKGFKSRFVLSSFVSFSMIFTLMMLIGVSESYQITYYLIANVILIVVLNFRHGLLK